MEARSLSKNRKTFGTVVTLLLSMVVVGKHFAFWLIVV